MPNFDPFIKISCISTNNYHITSHVIISNNRVTGNEQQILLTDTPDVTSFLDAAYRALSIDYPKFFKMDKLSKLGMLAAEVLLRGTAIIGRYAPEKVGIVLSNANASLDADMKYMESVRSIPSPALFVYTLPNIVIGEISIRYGFKGENAFFVQPVFDAEWLYFYTQDLLQHRQLEVVIAGWADVVGDDYRAIFFLVQKEAMTGSLPFSVQTINKLYV